MIEIKVDEQHVWIRAKSNDKDAMICLNNIVNEMQPGIIRDAFIGAIQEELSQKGEPS